MSESPDVDFSRYTHQQHFDTLPRDQKTANINQSYEEAIKEDITRTEDLTFIEHIRKQKEKAQDTDYEVVTFEKDGNGKFIMHLQQPITIPGDNDSFATIQSGKAYKVKMDELKILGPATNQDLYQRYRVKTHDATVQQVRFYLSDRGTVIGRIDGKIVLPNQNSSIKPIAGQEWIGRVEEKDRCYIFTPIEETTEYEDKALIINDSRFPIPQINSCKMRGIQKVEQKTLFPRTQQEADEIATRLTGQTKEDFLRLFHISSKYTEIGKDEHRQFEADQKKARKQAWEEYKLLLNTAGRKDHISAYEQMLADQGLTDSPFYQNPTVSAWKQTGKDYRIFINQELQILQQEPRRLVESLKNYEALDLEPALEVLKKSRPEGETLSISDKYERKAPEAIRYFRAHKSPLTVEIQNEYFDGKLVFEPSLDAYTDVNDVDWGQHRSDSTGATTWNIQYLLKNTDLTLNDDKFVSLSPQIRQKIQDQIIRPLILQLQRTSLRDDMNRHYADFIESYDTKISSLTALTRDDRLQLYKKALKAINENNNYFKKLEDGKIVPDEQAQIMWEKVHTADTRLQDLMDKFPIPYYSTVTAEGDIYWFGLPVERTSSADSNGGTSLYNIKYPSQFSLDFWLDTHKEYFEMFWESQQKYDYPSPTLTELDKKVSEHTKELATSRGLSEVSGYSGFIHKVDEDYLFVSAHLSPDYNQLRVTVTRLNNGNNSSLTREKVLKLCETIIQQRYSLSSGLAEQFKSVIGDADFAKLNLDIEPDHNETKKDEDKYRELPFQEVVDDPTGRPQRIIVGESKEDAWYRNLWFLKQAQNYPQIPGVKWMKESYDTIKGFDSSSQDNDDSAKKVIHNIQTMPDVKGVLADKNIENPHFTTHTLWIITPDGDKETRVQVYARKSRNGDGFVFDVSQSGISDIQYTIQRDTYSSDQNQKIYDPRFVRVEWRPVSDGQYWSEVVNQHAAPTPQAGDYKMKAIMEKLKDEAEPEKKEKANPDVLNRIAKSKLAKGSLIDKQRSQDGKVTLYESVKKPLMALVEGNQSVSTIFNKNFSLWEEEGWVSEERNGEQIQVLKTKRFRVNPQDHIPAAISVFSLQNLTEGKQLKRVITEGVLQYVMEIEQGKPVYYVYYEVYDRNNSGNPIKLSQDSESVILTEFKKEKAKGEKEQPILKTTNYSGWNSTLAKLSRPFG